MLKILNEALDGKEIEIKTLTIRDFKWLLWELYLKDASYIVGEGVIKVMK